MNKLTLGIGGILVGALATILVFRHDAQLRVRRANETIRQQNALLEEFQAENERLSGLLAPANRPTSAATEPGKELLRLRGELGVLRHQNQELAQMLLRKQGTPSPEGQDAFQPSSSWTDAGNTTPESAAETFCWAIKTGNASRLAEVLIQPQTKDEAQGMLLSEVSKGLEPLLSEIEASRFLVADNPAPDETTLWFQNRLKGGDTLVSPLTLKRVGNQWKVKFLPPE